MLVALNVLLIVFVLLIAYWWANQGLFSALLHLICVIAAGAIALAVWEPLTIGFLLKGGKFDDYAWGTVLIGSFAVALLTLRITMDRLIPGNVDLPHWANMAFGFPIGAAAGVITVGMFIIGAGFIQSNNNIMGFQGKARARGDTIQEVNKLWAPFHVWTGEFYNYLSVGSLYPTFNNTPLQHYNPEVHFQAASLLRDSARDGRAKFSLAPKAARIEEFLVDPNAKKYIVKMRFESTARDFGEQLTLSSSQIRLISPGRDFAKPKVVHPNYWTQYDGGHAFDDPSHYITTEPGQSEATVSIEFPSGAFTTVPKFIQIRNTRFRLPAVPNETNLAMARGGMTTSTARTTIDRGAPSIQGVVEQSNSIRPVVASTNQKPTRISLTSDNLIDGGDGEFATSVGDRPNRNLMIHGIYEPAGTRIVQVDVSRESEANIFGDVQSRAGNTTNILLVDNQGVTYKPIGFLHQKPDGKTHIKVDFQNYLPTMRDIPALPSAGGQPLRLFFAVTEGRTVVGLKVGDASVGACNLTVRDPKAPAALPPTDTAGGSLEG